jgi:hypothetical protein
MTLFEEFYNFNNFKMIINSWEFYLSTLLLVILCIVFDRGINKFCKIFGIIIDPLEIDLNKFETKIDYKEMSLIRGEIEEEINNDFTGAAFTYSYNNELKEAIDRRRKKMNVLVKEKNENNLNLNESIIKSKDIICPKCFDIAKICIKDYKIKLKCRNKHISNYILIDEYENSQKIDQSKIICHNCKIKNKGNTFKNELIHAK